jgi:hypothetical protein
MAPGVVGGFFVETRSGEPTRRTHPGALRRRGGSQPLPNLIKNLKTSYHLHRN